MAQPSDFYGNAKEVNINTGKPSIDLPVAQQPAGMSPVHFWLAMAALLIAARVVYELADRGA